MVWRREGGTEGAETEAERQRERASNDFLHVVLKLPDRHAGGYPLPEDKAQT